MNMTVLHVMCYQSGE